MLFIMIAAVSSAQNSEHFIRVNLLGYLPTGSKTAVWCSKVDLGISNLPAGRQGWELVDAVSKKTVYSAKLGKSFGAYGPFTQTYRFNFSEYKKPGRYYLQSGGVKSPEFKIAEDVYKGTADFCLRYMRQQRSGFNPFLKDSCHTHDGYTLYGEKAGIKDSTHIDVVGGWHDASDYLQYSTTSANATYHLLAAYRDFPKVFSDEKLANGLDGKNNMPDVLDEAKWGLDWLSKMHPREDWMFNQLGDDRDHISMRIPKLDSQYGKGFERPVYFVSGEPQQRGKFMNNSTGTSSTAAKFSSAFSLGFEVFNKIDTFYSNLLYEKAGSSYVYAFNKFGVTQTASVRSPYIYAEDNWEDDMELAVVMLERANRNMDFRRNKSTIFEFMANDERMINIVEEKITPWLGADTAKHYQWYPFINLGHYEMAKELKTWGRDSLTGYYKQGIEKVWNKAKQNAFYRGIPFIWCSNNLTTSFAIQCYWYKQLTGDKTFDELEQANFDWLFGCNPWGTSMVYGLPSWGDTPVDPHSAFTHLKNYPIDGGLVDGPVYGSIYNNLIGIKLFQPDEYAAFQSDLAVYHDDYGDYSTNEPTMDGTASLIYLLATKEASSKSLPLAGGETSATLLKNKFSYSHGGIIRGDSSFPSPNGGNRDLRRLGTKFEKGAIALVFTGHEFADGAGIISNTLQQQKIKASFFFTGDFYNNPVFKKSITQLKNNGHYLGAHSNKHLLYNDWNKRDSLLVTKNEFQKDLKLNYDAMKKFGITKVDYFLPPYEWYNDSIAAWTKEMKLQLINFSPGTKSNADYTYPAMKNYRSSEEIYNSIIDFENKNSLNGFILLLHIGTDPKRTDKFYYKLNQLIENLKQKGYTFRRVDELLN